MNTTKGIAGQWQQTTVLAAHVILPYPMPPTPAKKGHDQDLKNSTNDNDDK